MPGHTMAKTLALAAAGLIVAGCGGDAPTGFDPDASHARSPGPVGASLSPSQFAQTLNALRAHTAPWHNIEKAEGAGYTLDLGCSDERFFGGTRGMGHHVTIAGDPPPLLVDDTVRLLEPEFLVYGIQPGSGQRRLAAFDYFVPASDRWPAPDEGGVPPTLPELGIPFTWNPEHNGWMFHIWLWWHNPDGMFDDFNPTVPLCD